MKRFRLLSLGLVSLSLAFMFSCGGGGGGGSSDPVPTADFTINTAEADFKVGALIFVEFKGKNAKSYEWDFGDGSDVRVNRSDTAVYQQPGTYTITLTAYSQSGRKGASAKKSRTITITAGNRISFKQLIIYNAFTFELQERKKNTNADPRLRIGYAQPSPTQTGIVSVTFIHTGEPIVTSSIADSIIFELSGSASPIAMKQLQAFIAIADIPTSGQGTVLGRMLNEAELDAISQITPPATARMLTYSYRQDATAIPEEYRGKRVYTLVYDVTQ